MRGFPGVIGCVDCTRVRIRIPSEHEVNQVYTRVMIEQTIGGSFHVLHTVNRMHDPNANCRVIGATAVLHNVAEELKEPLWDLLVDAPMPGMPQPDVAVMREGLRNGFQVRQRLIDAHFNHL